MAQQWEVVGGADKGGVLVREGKELKSEQCKERLAHGAIVEEVELVGERLHYKVVNADWGPDDGWVSLKVAGKDIVIKKTVDAGGPADTAFAVEVDAALKTKIEKLAKDCKDKKLFDLCAPKCHLKLLGGPLEAGACKFRIICFHNAGSTETNYTAPSTDLVKWLKGTKCVEMVAVDYPGRQKLGVKDYPFKTNTQELAEWLLAVIYDKIADGVPYVVWGHSVGTWVAFELLMLARQIGLPMPKAAFLNAFPAPHMPVGKRPWRRSKTLSDAEIKKELTGWDATHFSGAGKVVFDAPNWESTWKPMMQGDFQLYDEYVFKHAGAPKFDFPFHCWHMAGENYNKQDMIAMWEGWTTGEWDHCALPEMGHLTAFYNPEFKKTYFAKIQALIEKYAAV